MGFDGSWIIHPLLVEAAQKCYSQVIRNAFNQKHRMVESEFEIPLHELYSF